MQKIELNPILTIKESNKFSDQLTERYTINTLSEQINSITISPKSATSLLSNQEGYYIVPIRVNDTKPVIRFLREFFFRDEPLNVEQKLLENEDSTCQELEEYCEKCIKDNVSIMAKSATGKLIGVCINGTSSPNTCTDDDDDDDDDDDIEKCENPKFRKILRLLQMVDNKANVFGKFPDVKNVLEVKILSVDGAWRGRGIAKALTDRARDFARELGFTMVRVDCTSHFSARAVARLGFDCIYTLKYEDYQIDGRPVFMPELPHTEVKVYVQRVD